MNPIRFKSIRAGLPVRLPTALALAAALGAGFLAPRRSPTRPRR
ncbi:MAG: hypothetical protein NTW21_04115 [Verrucomicrobia bacterium]|nr:hypothetical protein [Verrucomicrobiota bacterium]